MATPAATPTDDEGELGYARQAGYDPEALGVREQAPSPGNAWGAIVAPTLDPTERPDVLNPNGSRSSLISSSDRVRSADGTPVGEMLYPQVTEDGREIGPDYGYDLAKGTNKHLGIYSSIPMADQAAIAMHNAGAAQMESPSFQPTGWYLADQPGMHYASQAERDAAANAHVGKQIETDKQAARDKLDQDIADHLKGGENVDPDRLWHRVDTGKKVDLAIMAMRGQRGDGMLAALNGAQERDLQAQKIGLEAKRRGIQVRESLYSRLVDEGHDKQVALLATKQAQDRVIIDQMEAARAKAQTAAQRETFDRAIATKKLQSAQDLLQLEQVHANGVVTHASAARPVIF